MQQSNHLAPRWAACYAALMGPPPPRKMLQLRDIVLMNIVAVASLRWIASAGANGPSSIVLWSLATLIFFLPEGLAVAHLSARFPVEGGLYRWTQRAFGDRHGFVCGWCYWVTNLLYLPALLLYVSANVALALRGWLPQAQLGEERTFVVIVTLGTLWLVTGLSLIGMRAGKWIQNLGALGNWIPAVTVAVLGAILFAKHGSATAFTWLTILPHLDSVASLSFFSQMCFALAGLELVSFLGGEIQSPERTITRGILISAGAILSIYLLGTLGILVCVGQEKITLLNGILLPIETAGASLGIGPWLAAVCAAFIALAGLGSVMAWFAGAARVPYVVGLDAYLPESLGRLHPRFGTPYVALLVQAALATLFTLFATAGASTAMETAYKILVDMCLVLYFIPYLYLFLSLYRLGVKHCARDTRRVTRVARGFVAGVGLLSTAVAILTATLPVDDGSRGGPSEPSAELSSYCRWGLRSTPGGSGDSRPLPPA